MFFDSDEDSIFTMNRIFEPTLLEFKVYLLRLDQINLVVSYRFTFKVFAYGHRNNSFQIGIFKFCLF